MAVRAVLMGATAVAMSVTKDGRSTWSTTAGVGNLRTGTPRSADDRYRVGSITKAFVSTVLLQLEAEGRGRPGGDRDVPRAGLHAGHVLALLQHELRAGRNGDPEGHRPLVRHGDRLQAPGRRTPPRHCLDTVEQLITLAEKAGLPLTHLAMAFAIAHPGVTSAIIGPRTMPHLDDLLACADTVLPDELLDEIDALVPPGTDVGTLDMAYAPPAIQRPVLRRRAPEERPAATN